MRQLEPAGDVILYTDEHLGDGRIAKTAYAVLRFCPERVRAIVDRRYAGRPLGSVCPGVAELEVPIVASFEELSPTCGSIVVGIAPSGGRLSAHQHGVLLAALEAGYSVVSGLHQQLPPGPNVVNLRAPDPADRVLARGAPGSATCILTVGTSACIGKMTTTILLRDALVARGVDADWLATGQTGVIIRARGSVIDSIVIDFVPGTIERLVGEIRSAVVVIEGQGSIFHPAFSPSALALMHASRSRYHVLCHRCAQTHHDDTDVALPSIEDAARGHQVVFEVLGIESELLAVSLDSSRITAADYQHERDAIAERLGVPCCDPVRESAGPMAEAFVALPMGARGGSGSVER
jgi:uncharacterized NAD-dependent epimerase/dehydratase family protein